MLQNEGNTCERVHAFGGPFLRRSTRNPHTQNDVMTLGGGAFRSNVAMF